MDFIVVSFFFFFFGEPFCVLVSVYCENLETCPQEMPYFLYSIYSACLKFSRHIGTLYLGVLSLPKNMSLAQICSVPWMNWKILVPDGAWTPNLWLWWRALYHSTTDWLSLVTRKYLRKDGAQFCVCCCCFHTMFCVCVLQSVERRGGVLHERQRAFTAWPSHAVGAVCLQPHHLLDQTTERGRVPAADGGWSNGQYFTLSFDSCGMNKF